MNNYNKVENTKSPQKVDCDDIYVEEISKTIKTLKRFREFWLRSTSSWNSDLFQYADPDFYFYRFAIERQEENSNTLLSNILCRVMERYGVRFETLPNTPFEFIINDHERTGYRYENFYYDDDVNEIAKAYNVDDICIIRSWKPGRADEWIKSENEQYHTDGLKQKAISVKTFFERFFCEEEYVSFTAYVEKYLQQAKDITGYKSIKFLSAMNLATLKLYEEKELANWDYHNYSFEIIDKNNEEVSNYLYLSNKSFSPSVVQTMENNYVANELFRTMVGINEYAESFITSEWLYQSLKGKRNFDYTSVISGYLKSVEQLLYRIVMINVNNKCKITMSGENEKITKAISNNVVAYKRKRGKWVVVPVNINDKEYKFIDLTNDQIQYMDSSIGTFEIFLRNNPHIFVNKSDSKTIADMVCCFRKECRNGFFHTHNLKEWDIVEKTRSNAIYLYFVLLGGCLIPEEKIHELAISIDDDFDLLCKKIRDFRHYSTNFIFEYADGNKIKLVYDFINNTVEYTSDGVEHYENLLFYKVDDFSLETYEKLDEGIKEEQKIFLTRSSLPRRIWGVHMDKKLEEILF